MSASESTQQTADRPEQKAVGSNATEPVDPVASTERLPKVPEGVVAEPGRQVLGNVMTAPSEPVEGPSFGGGRIEPALGSVALDSVSDYPYEVPGALQLLTEEDEDAETLSPLQEVGIGAAEEMSFVDVVVSLCDEAIEATKQGTESGEALTGRRVAEIFCQGDVADARVAFLLNLLAQNRPVTGQLVLGVARSLGFAEYVAQALATAQELSAVGGVAVEAVSVPVSFQGAVSEAVVP